MSEAQLTFPFPAEERFGRDAFVKSPANHDASLFLRAWPRWPAYGMLLSGPEASGKTHLAHIWAEQAGATFLPLEDVSHIYDISKIPALVLENADQLADETGFFHLLNCVRERQGSILLTSRIPLSLWPQRLPDLLSRLRALPHLTLNAPDDALLAAVLRKYFRDRQMILPEEVINYLLPRMERSLAVARVLAGRLDAASFAGKRPVSLTLARHICENVNPM